MDNLDSEKGPDQPHDDDDAIYLDLYDRTGSSLHRRLDALFSDDPETGAVPTEALMCYTEAMMEMVSRYGQTLAVLNVGMDTGTESSSVLRFFGAAGALLIGRAIVRCLHQETRIYDVVGRAEADFLEERPSFFVVCPLMDENRAAKLAERLRAAMTAYASEPDYPWLIISVGIAAATLEAQDARTLLSHASEALRSARTIPGGGIWKHSDTVRRIMENNEGDASGN